MVAMRTAKTAPLAVAVPANFTPRAPPAAQI